jgi:hypothetical protein
MDQKNQPANKQGAIKLKAVAQAYTFSKDGFPRIRKAAMTFAAVLILSIALVAACRTILLRAQPGTAQAQAKQNAARDKFMQAESERVEIRDFLPKFEQLRARGFYGNENRLNMLEAIKSIQENRRLLPISYEFAPQQLVPVEPALLAASLELRVTTIALRFGLLHELDLFNFLQDLKGKGFYTAKDCNLTPVDAIANSPLAPRLMAECTLYWATVGEPAAATADGAKSPA